MVRQYAVVEAHSPLCLPTKEVSLFVFVENGADCGRLRKRFPCRRLRSGQALRAEEARRRASRGGGSAEASGGASSSSSGCQGHREPK